MPCPDSRWTPLLLLWALSAILLYPCLSFFLFEPDEGRYAQIPREMLTRGEWIVPQLQGEPYLDKPPLFYWLVMGCYAVFGYHDWAARLVPAFAVQGCILMTYLFGRRLVGERAAFWGALVLTLAPGFTGMGRLLLLDGVLAFLVTLAVFSAWRALDAPVFRHSWWALAALACGLGVLTKGPVALALFVPSVWLSTRLPLSLQRPGWRNWLQFFLIVFLVALPWYVAVCVRVPDFARHFFWVHNVQRFVEPFDHSRPVWFYAPIVFLGLMPASLWMIPCGRFLLSLRRQPGSSRGHGYLLLSAAWGLLFFSLSGSKLPTYILPTLVPVALLFGAFLAQAPWKSARWFQGALAGWCLLSVLGHNVILPQIALARSPMADQSRMTALCGNPNVPVICFPRHIDSVAFYVGRADFPAIHTRDLAKLFAKLDEQPRTVILFGHRNSLHSLKELLPPHLRMVEEAPMGLCDLGVVERAAVE